MSVQSVFNTEHAWDSLEEITPSQEYLTNIITAIIEEYQKGLLPFLSFEHFEELHTYIPQFDAIFSTKKNLIVIGIGGSCVGIKALVQLLCLEEQFSSHKKIYFAENVDAGYMQFLQESLDPKETVLLVISKSGNTIETVSQYLLLKEWLIQHCHNSWKEHCLIITDDKEGFLYSEAMHYTLLCASIPSTLGGRYSVLSAVGILPMLFLGKDYNALMKGAMDSARDIIENITRIQNNPLWDMVLWQYSAELQGKTQTILFSYIPRSTDFGLWFMQLWAESLGKESKGTFPIFAQGVVDQHSLQQMFLDGKHNATCIFLYEKESQYSGTCILADTPRFDYINNMTLQDILFAEYKGTVDAFIQKNIPHVEYTVPQLSEYSIANIIVFFQTVVFVLGKMLGINPLNQPAVEYGKCVTKRILQDTIHTQYNSL